MTGPPDPCDLSAFGFGAFVDTWLGVRDDFFVGDWRGDPVAADAGEGTLFGGAGDDTIHGGEGEDLMVSTETAVHTGSATIVPDRSGGIEDVTV